MTKNSTPKRARGRPRKGPAPTGTSARETAAALGITRARLLRYVEEGCPSQLSNERRFFDIDAARSWIEAREDDGPQIPNAKIYHPSDPRYRQSAASGKIRQRKLDVEAGVYIQIGDARPIIRTAFDALQHGLKALPSGVFYEGMTASNAVEILAPMVEDILTNNFPLDAADWPVPVVDDDIGTTDAVEDPGSEFEQAYEYAPMLPSHDPRAIEATAKAKAMEAELAALLGSTVHVADFRQVVAAIADEVKRVVRLLPQMVADTLGDGSDNVKEIIEDRITVVRILIRGASDDDGDGKVAEALQVVTGGLPYTVVDRVQASTILAGAPAGAEFDLPECADMDAVLAALKHYPRMSHDVVSEFG